MTYSSSTLLTSESGSHNIDLYSVVKAYQVISREINLDRLLEKLLKIVIENVDAQNGYLLLKETDDFIVRGSYHIESGIFQNKNVKTEIPTSVIHYIIRTNDVLICNNAINDDRFNKDKVVLNKPVKSVLSIPLKSKKFIGIIYLENNSLENAFTLDCVEFLKLIATQATISIENAMLFSKKNKLKITKPAAKANFETQSQFLAHLSHKIRAPLNVILGYSSILKETDIADEHRDYLNSIVSSCKLLLSLINDIWDFSKIKEDKINLKSELLPFGSVIKDIEEGRNSTMTCPDLIPLDSYDKELPTTRDNKAPKQLLPNLSCDLNRTDRANLLKALKTIKKESYHKLKKQMIIGNIAKFAEHIYHLAATFDFFDLKKWSEDLKQSANNCDLIKTKHMLNQFPSLIHIIEQNMKQ